jgi:hypothetical protein
MIIRNKTINFINISIAVKTGSTTNQLEKERHGDNNENSEINQPSINRINQQLCHGRGRLLPSLARLQEA